tara:strand:- start:654 stop:1109 length:456 start_codon:yes stop_codon:yes gene_type:complete
MAIDGSMNIVQIQSMTWTTATFMDDCQSRQDVTGWVETITAKLTGSKILVHAQFTGILDCDGCVGFKRDGNVVVDNWLGTDRDVGGSSGYHDSNTYSGMYLDDFSTVAGQTYSYQMTTIVTGCGDDAWFNRDPSNSNNNGRSSLTLFEVSG